MRLLEFGQNYFSNLLQFLELFKACSNILGSRAEVLKVCDPVALSWGVQGPDGQRCTDALGHFCQKGLHGSHLALVDHEPPARVEGVSVPVHHHALHRGQDGHTGGARRHFQASCCRQSAKDALFRQRVEHIHSQIKPPALFFPAHLGSAGIYIPLLTSGTHSHKHTHAHTIFDPRARYSFTHKAGAEEERKSPKLGGRKVRISPDCCGDCPSGLSLAVFRSHALCSTDGGEYIPVAMAA